MTLNELNPRKALNKAFLKIKSNRSRTELFKDNLMISNQNKAIVL
jgi:hypothetical protein